MHCYSHNTIRRIILCQQFLPSVGVAIHDWIQCFSISEYSQYCYVSLSASRRTHLQHYCITFDVVVSEHHLSAFGVVANLDFLLESFAGYANSFCNN